MWLSSLFCGALQFRCRWCCNFETFQFVFVLLLVHFQWRSGTTSHWHLHFNWIWNSQMFWFACRFHLATSDMFHLDFTQYIFDEAWARKFVRPNPAHRSCGEVVAFCSRYSVSFRTFLDRPGGLGDFNAIFVRWLVKWPCCPLQSILWIHWYLGALPWVLKHCRASLWRWSGVRQHHLC